MNHSIPPAARWLGALGIVPQAVFLVLALWEGSRFTFAAQAMGFAYAALIFSFVGGMWWGLAAAAGRPPLWVWLASVAPSLLALLSFVPWAIAGDWPGPSLVLLGLAMMISLLVDVRLIRIGAVPRWWWRLRAPLSIGLGAITVAMGLLAWPR